MPDEPLPSQPQYDRDPRRVRIGLVMLVIVVVVAAVLAAAVDSPLARLLMLGIIVFTVARAFVLVRSLRRDTEHSRSG